MQKSILIVALAIIAVAFVAADQPQGISVTQLTNGVPTNGRIPDNKPTGVDYYTNVYSYFVPANASYINVTITNTADGDQCETLYTFYRSTGAPCTTDNYAEENWFCPQVPEQTVSYGESEYFFITPGYGVEQAEFVAGQTIWVGVANYYSFENNCTYTVTVSSVALCPNNQMSITSDLDYESVTLACSSYTTVPSSGVNSYNVSLPAPASGDKAFALFVMNVPLETANIQVRLNVSSDLYVYGTQFSALGYSDNYKCSVGNSQSCGSSYYCINVTCDTPRMGMYVIQVYDTIGWNGTITFSSTQCPAGFGGPTCNFTETALYLNQTAPISITVPYSSAYSVYNEAIYYIDVPANHTGPDFYIMASSTASSAYLIPRINGYPTSSDAGNELYDYYSISTSGSYFAIGSFDFVMSGRYYFGFACEDSSAACVINLSFNTSTPSSSTSSSTGVPTTTTTASSSATTTTTTTTASSTASSTASTTTASGSSTASTTSSGVEVIVPSIVLLLVALLLF